jgi:hypothetical protein
MITLNKRQSLKLHLKLGNQIANRKQRVTTEKKEKKRKERHTQKESKEKGHTRELNLSIAA